MILKPQKPEGIYDLSTINEMIQNNDRFLGEWTTMRDRVLEMIEEVKQFPNYVDNPEVVAHLETNEAMLAELEGKISRHAVTQRNLAKLATKFVLFDDALDILATMWDSGVVKLMMGWVYQWETFSDTGKDLALLAANSTGISFWGSDDYCVLDFSEYPIVLQWLAEREMLKAKG